MDQLTFSGSIASRATVRALTRPRASCRVVPGAGRRPEDVFQLPDGDQRAGANSASSLIIGLLKPVEWRYPMKTIETTAMIGEDRVLTVQLPQDVMPGRRQVAVIIDEAGAPVTTTLDDFPTIDVGPWPFGLLLRREDMYGDDGR